MWQRPTAEKNRGLKLLCKGIEKKKSSQYSVIILFLKHIQRYDNIKHKYLLDFKTEYQKRAKMMKFYHNK